jgi:exopolyphosphatase/guanosine-5'-triphosphate,3'-diphosphate pyrophosphatase
MKRVDAVIDVGTITILFLVAETEECNDSSYKKRKIVRILENVIEYARLGEGVHKNREFSKEAMLRAKPIFKKLSELAKKHKVEKLVAVATSASRDAKNAKEFYDEIEKEFNIKVQIIDGETESKLSFFGGLLDYHDPKNYALMDIGGGSTEFVALNDDGKLIGKSVDVGSIRATEIFLEGDPYTKASLDKLEVGLKEHWKSLPQELALHLQKKEWVAVAGTPTILAALSLGLRIFTHEQIDGYRIPRCEVWDYFESFAIQSKKERSQIHLIGKQRADVIVAGTAILATAMEFFNKDEVIVSTRGLRHGALVLDF